MYSVSGGGANAVKVGNKLGANSGVSEVMFHHTELALSAFLSSIKLNLLALYHLELALMRLISVYISNNTRVLEVYDGIVDGESRGGRGVEDVEVVVLDPRAIKVGRWVCLRMKGDGILGITLLADPYNMSVDSHLPKNDISRYFVLTILIEKDKRVLPHITVVILTPSGPWMIRVIELLSELGDIGNGTRHGGEGDGGVICSESNWLITLNVVIRYVALNLVKNLRNKEEVFDGSIVTKGGSETWSLSLVFPKMLIAGRRSSVHSVYRSSPWTGNLT